MRRVVIGALLVVMPFSGVRVVCLDSSAAPSHPVARVEAVSDCERLCPLHPAASHQSETESRSDAGGESDCALSVDGATMSVVVTSAVPRPHLAFPAPATVAAVVVETPRLYVEPTLAHLAPPPKSRAL